MAQPIFNQGTGGVADSLLPIQTARSGNYTVSAADVATGFSVPIELLWPVPFVDTNYTVAVSVEKIFGIKAPAALVHAAQFERMRDVQTGLSQGIIIVFESSVAMKAGDTYVIHA